MTETDLPSLDGAGAVPGQALASGLETFLQRCCEELLAVFDLCGAYAVGKETDGTLRLLAHGGDRRDFLRELLQEDLRWDDGSVPDSLVEALASGHPRVLATADPALPGWRGSAARHGIRRVAVVPLRLGEAVAAALILCAVAAERFDAVAGAGLLEALARLFQPALQALAERGPLVLLGGALGSAACPVYITDREGVIQWVNDAFVQLTGYSRAELIGRNPRLLRSGLQNDDYYQAMYGCLQAGRAWTGEITDRCKDGRLYVAEQTITPINAGNRGQSGCFVAIQQDISERKNMEREIRELVQHIEKARLAERCQLARELHDELGGSLASLRHDIEWLLQRSREPELQERLQIMLELATASLATARQVIAGLRPTLVDELGLQGALRWLIRDFLQHQDIEVKAELPAELGQLDPLRASEVFRVVQEALTNVAKHAHATAVTVSARVGPELVVDVIDNGVGMACGEGSGTHSMTERAALMGGYLEIAQLDGRGTRVRLRIPTKREKTRWLES